MRGAKTYDTLGNKKKHLLRRVEFGCRIAQLRTGKKLTQAELASDIGVSRTSIVNMEQGHQLPPITLLPELAKALGTTVTVLVKNLDGTRG